MCEVRGFYFSVCCKGDVNAQGWCDSNLGENSKEHSSSIISTKASFYDASNQETLNVNKVFQ